MATSLTITGYDTNCDCEHCGRPLVHGVRTAQLGTIGADCFNKLIVSNTRRFSGGKPGAPLIRDLAKMRERYNDDGLQRLGRYPHHFAFEVAA